MSDKLMYRGHMNGQRYLGDVSTLTVHDLVSWKAETHLCKVPKIIKAGDDRPFNTLTAAGIAGYKKCKWCFSGN